MKMKNSPSLVYITIHKKGHKIKIFSYQKFVNEMNETKKHNNEECDLFKRFSFIVHRTQQNVTSFEWSLEELILRNIS